MTPPCSRTICRARCSPTPTPAFSLRRVASPVEKGWSNALARPPLGPGRRPRSVTRRRRRPRRARRATSSTVPPGGEYRHALSRSSRDHAPDAARRRRSPRAGRGRGLDDRHVGVLRGRRRRPRGGRAVRGRVGMRSSANVPRSSSARVMISSTIPISLSREAWSCSRNSSRSPSGTDGLREHVGDPLATVTGVRSSCEMFARKSAFAEVPSDTSSRRLHELVLELADASRRSARAPRRQRRRRSSGQGHRRRLTAVASAAVSASGPLRSRGTRVAPAASVSAISRGVDDSRSARPPARRRDGAEPADQLRAPDACRGRGRPR